MPIHTPPKENLVIFCGAGFSAPIGIPTMNRFGEELRKSGFLSPEEQADLDHVQEVCDSLASTIGASARNLEQLSSFLSILELARPDFQFAACREGMKRPHEVTAKILQCISFMVRPDLHSSEIATFSEHDYADKQDAPLLVDLLCDANVSFVTTNYDVHIELAIANRGKRVRVPDRELPWKTEHFRAGCQLPMYSDDVNAIPVFKLHGSVHWIKDSGKTTYCDAIIADSLDHNDIPTGVRLQCATHNGSRSQAADWCRTNTPVIVPPSVLKPSMLGYDLLRKQWDGACKALAAADRLWFIGYSFPESDSFMRYFLGSALFKNSRLREIVVIDPDRDVIDNRARPLFAQPHHQNAFLGIPASWKEVQFSELYQGRLEKILEERTFEEMRKRLDRENTLAGLASPTSEPAASASPRVRDWKRRGR